MDWSAWQEAIKALSEPQRVELAGRIGPAADYLPASKASPSEFATALVDHMKVNPGLFEMVAAELARLKALAPPLRLERWLKVQWEHHRAVPVVGGRGEQYRLPIEHIYVPLAFTDHGAFRPDQREKQGVQLRDESGRVSVELAFAELERRRDRGLLCGLSVVGKPGAGKTTLLSSLVAGATPAPHGSGSVSLGLPAHLLPIVLRFARLWRRVVCERPATLEALIEEEADRLVAGAGPALVGRGRRLLILLDGLDEVPDEDARIKVCLWLVAQAPAWREEARLVVTCRLAAWDRAGEALRTVLLPLSVQGFDRGARERYVRAWFPLVYASYRGIQHDPHAAREEAADRAERLLQAIGNADAGAAWRLEAMARNPLLLSVMCLVHMQRGQLPRTRRLLYEECLNILLETWHKHQGRERPIPAEPALRALAPLAWRMQSARAAGDQDATSLGEREILEILSPLVRPERGLDLDAAGFLRWLGDNGVLESPDVGRWRFAHLTFQEHLAARHAGERNLEGELAGHLEEAWWRETILLATAQPGFYARFLEAAWVREPGEHGAEVLRAARDESESEDIEPHRRVVLAAVAAVAALTAPPAPPEGWWPKLLVGLALRRPPPPPDPGPPPWRVRLALELAPTAARAPLVEQSRPLSRHPDLALSRAVAALLGPAEPASSSRAPQPGERRTFEAGGVRMEAVWVPAGAFWMGSGAEGEEGYDPGAYADERPRHRVTIPQGFWLGRFPVTNGHYAAYLRAAGGREPFSMLNGGFDAPEQPVLEVDWHEAMAFCAWWSGLSNTPRADLPTEAEWEWAARGPDGRRYPWGDEPPDASRARYDSPSSAPVGERPAGRGPFGAEEQAGNAWEWCRSIWRPYQAGEQVDNCQEGDVSSDAPRVLRGGSWFLFARNLRVAFRNSCDPRDRYGFVGFRVVLRSPQHR